MGYLNHNLINKHLPNYLNNLSSFIEDKFLNTYSNNSGCLSGEDYLNGKECPIKRNPLKVYPINFSSENSFTF